MQTTSSATAELPEPEIRHFLEYHIPYRLEFLRRAAALRSYPGARDPALVEAALMAGRQLVQFLGFGLKFSQNGRPFLSDEKSEDYHPYYRDGVPYTDEVKIKNLGVECLKLSDLKDGEDDTLAEFLHGANKSTAHLTEGSGHRLNHEGGKACAGRQALRHDALHSRRLSNRRQGFPVWAGWFCRHDRNLLPRFIARLCSAFSQSTGGTRATDRPVPRTTFFGPH